MKVVEEAAALVYRKEVTLRYLVHFPKGYDADEEKEWPFVFFLHGAEDETVPLAQSQELVDALKSVGGNVRFTVYEGVGHDSWTATYNNQEVTDWMLKQRNKDFEL